MDICKTIRGRPPLLASPVRLDVSVEESLFHKIERLAIQRTRGNLSEAVRLALQAGIETLEQKSEGAKAK